MSNASLYQQRPHKIGGAGRDLKRCRHQSHLIIPCGMRRNPNQSYQTGGLFSSLPAPVDLHLHKLSLDKYRYRDRGVHGSPRSEYENALEMRCGRISRAWRSVWTLSRVSRQGCGGRRMRRRRAKSSTSRENPKPENWLLSWQSIQDLRGELRLKFTQRTTEWLEQREGTDGPCLVSPCHSHCRGHRHEQNDCQEHDWVVDGPFKRGELAHSDMSMIGGNVNIWCRTCACRVVKRAKAGHVGETCRALRREV